MKKISTLKERILYFIDFKGISKNKFYQETGISNGVLDKKSGVTSTTIEKFISTYPEVNEIWLINGQEPMMKSHVIKRVDNIILIPLVSTEVAAGFGNENFAIKEEDIQARYVVPDFNGIDFMIRVKGSSMYPKYSSGDVIACRILKERNFIQWNKTYVVATKEQGMICKRLLPSKKKDFIQVVSDNKDYPPFDIPEKEITGIALIVGVIRLE